MFNRFTKEARGVVVHAQSEAGALGARAVGPEHLLLGVALTRPDDRAARALAGAGLDGPALRSALDRDLAEALAPLGIPAEAVEAVGPAVATGRNVRFGPAAKQALEQGMRAAVQRGDRHITSLHVLLGVLRTPSPAVQRLLDRAGTDRDSLTRALS